jgi:energy-coupling factor transporter ATP-binding protein EcfA2
LGARRSKQGWTCSYAQKRPTKESGYWHYAVELRFRKNSGRIKDLELVEKQWKEINKYLNVACNNKNRFSDNPWITLKTEENNKEEVEETNISQALENKDVKKDYANINLNKHDYFDHIYDRNHQIEMVIKAINLAVETKMAERRHVVLLGPPGCGKTTILGALSKMLGNEDEAYIYMNGAATSKAGAEAKLGGANIIPPIMFIEEIEKTTEDSLRWLLTVLDERAELRKLNYRVDIRKSVPILCIATANSEEKFEGFDSGSLASRFSSKVYCQRPERNVLKQILKREIDKLSGHGIETTYDWIDPTLDYCLNEEKNDDPRHVITVCLTGRDGLLDGSFQETLKAVRKEGSS